MNDTGIRIIDVRDGRRRSRAAGVAVLSLELRKLLRGAPTIVASVATLAVVAAVTGGGYLAASSGGRTMIGTKATAIVTVPGWPGLIGLAATAAGVAVLLASGVVMSWHVGREFADGTVVGLCALPVSPANVAVAKAISASVWGVALALACGLVAAGAGLAVGLSGAGVVTCIWTVSLVATSIAVAAAPVMWVATVGRGYLAGIGATLALVVATNLLSGFGVGAWLPWSAPVLWAMPGSTVTLLALVGAPAVAVSGYALTWHAWRCLQLGDR